MPPPFGVHVISGVFRFRHEKARGGEDDKSGIAEAALIMSDSSFGRLGQSSFLLLPRRTITSSIPHRKSPQVSGEEIASGTGTLCFEFLHLEPFEDLADLPMPCVMSNRRTFLPSPLAARMRALTSRSMIRLARFLSWLGTPAGQPGTRGKPATPPGGEVICNPPSGEVLGTCCPPEDTSPRQRWRSGAGNRGHWWRGAESFN